MAPVRYPRTTTSRKKHADHVVNPAGNEVTGTRQTVMICGPGFLPESVGGEACSCQDSREGGVQTSVSLARTVLSGAKNSEPSTLGTLTRRLLRGVFFASVSFSP